MQKNDVPNNRYFPIDKHSHLVDFICTLQPLVVTLVVITSNAQSKHRIENCTVVDASIRAGITLVIRLAKRFSDFETPHIFKWYMKKLHGKLCLREFYYQIR